MTEKYIKGYYAGVLGRRKYLIGLGFKLNRLDVETERVERVDDDFLSEQTSSLQGRYPGELEELISQGFGEKSFVDRNHPYQDRQHGVSEQVRARRVEESNSHKGKKCPHCIAGFKITSKFIKCTSCDSLSHQRKKYQGKWCADLKQVPFYCNACLAQKLGFENEMEEVIYNQSFEDLVEMKERWMIKK